MADIINIQEAWANHTGLEVETFIKGQITALLASLGGKFGDVQFNPSTMTITFYDEAGGTPLGNVQLGGNIYTIAPNCNLSQVFYVLADEAEKIMSISPTTTKSTFGSSESEPFPEGYSYVVAVNSGAGYVDRVNGTIQPGGTASWNVKPYLRTGDNYVRVSVTGLTSGQTSTTVFTGTLTTLTMSVNHTWQNVWTQGQDYNITGIRFSGNLYKTLHVSIKVGNTTTELTPVEYSPSQSYTTTSTYYTIPASAFPSGGSKVVQVNIWMTAEGVSTPVVSYNIMCAAENDTTPLVAINAITPRAYNFTSGTLFSYAVYNANKVTIGMSATLGSSNYNIATAIPEEGLEAGVQYPFAYSLEVDTGANNEQLGSLGISVKAYFSSTEGLTATASTLFDNTYSYLATPGYLFYLNAATRSNGTSDKETIVNEAGASQDGRFAASYSGEWTGLSWYNDGWGTDPLGYKALAIPAGCSLSVPTLKPLELLPYYDGMTIEFMLQCGSPSDYSEPVFTIATSGANPKGIVIYPTKITVWENAKRDEDYQTINFSENAMTHICVTIQKAYEGRSGKNLVSVYINGTSNICFDFVTSDFGNGGLYIGQSHTDAYLYKMRVYGSALEYTAVFNNFLNSIVDGVEFYRSVLNEKNDVLLGNSVDYDLVKAAGLNVLVVTTPNNVPIPSFYNDVKVSGCTVRFEYAGASTKNVTVGGVTMDGQGTTSKKYYRWNLRWSTNDDTTWTYGDGTTGTPGKTGRVINDTDYIGVDRITAKKNIASSPQGHKMGMTGLFNDLFKQMGLDAELPQPASGPSYQVAVYQFPFVGFQYNTDNGQYIYIGDYTCGPDKGSKATFGYIKSLYPNCLSIEGPNHNPRGTRFLCPWVDVTYDPAQETLCFGGEEGWDCDYVKWERSDEGTQSDWDNILALYNSEWQPAYNCVYDNSPYLASYQEVINAVDDPSITTLANLLTTGNAGAVKAAFTNGMAVANEYIAFYDSSYDLYFYRRSTGKYEKLPNDYQGYKNALTDLTSYLSALGYSTSAPTTAQLIEARGARFKATMGTYFSQDQTLYHYVFCLLYGVTDNFAKNSYPFKFYKYSDTLPSGVSAQAKKWGWRQDDLDSVLMTDNNGTNTKKYSVEHGDTANNVQIFQGGTSALWVLVRDYFQDECAAMMGRIANAANSLATALGIAGSGLHESLFNLTSYYCWDHSAKYFPPALYESDRRWAYIEPWLLAGTTRPGTSEQYPATYNGVEPLTQAVGDQLQGEKLWVERRIAYMFSKYRVGAFTGDHAGYGMFAFTLASSFTFHITPAIDLYPVVSTGSEDSQGPRTPAGQVANVTVGTTGDTTNYMHGTSWLADLGDLSGMELTSRGTSEAIPFSLTGARLQSLKIGDATAGNVDFNATSFGVTSPTLVSLDARNTATITNIVNLLGCPRLRTVKFAGSGAAGLYLPVGAKLTEVSFPDNASTVFMHSLPFLQASDLTLPALAGISSLYINNCDNLNPFSIVESILAATGNVLAYVTLIWSGVLQGSVDSVLALADLAGRVTFENNTPDTQAGTPDVEGTVQVQGLYEQDITDLDITYQEDYPGGLKKALSGLFGTNLYIIYDPNKIYIEFEDDVVKQICVTNWGDGTGITRGQAALVTDFGTAFQNSAIQTFSEVPQFTGLTTLNYAFQNCTSLTRITTPSKPINEKLILRGVFDGCANLERIDDWDFVNTQAVDTYYAFRGCAKLKHIYLKSLEKWLACSFGATQNPTYRIGPFDGSDEGHIYLNGQEIINLVVPSGTTKIGEGVFRFCKSLASVSIPSSVTEIGGGAFNSCTSLETVTIQEGVQIIGASAFSGCSKYVNIELPSTITSIGNLAFAYIWDMRTFVCRANTPPTLSGTPIGGSCPIYVPYSADDSIVNAYKTSWSSYSSRIQSLNPDGTIPNNS